MKTILISLLLCSSLFAVAPVPGGNVGAALDPSNNYAFLHVDSMGRCLLSGSGAGAGIPVPGGNIGIALDPSNNYAFLHVDVDGGLITSGGGGGSVSITSAGTLNVSPSPLTGTGTIDLNLGSANTWTVPQAVNIAAVGSAQTVGFLVENTTPAALNTQQFSPLFMQYGSGWKTDSTAGPQNVAFGWQVQPIQGTAAPTGIYQLYSRVGAGSLVPVMSTDLTGNFTFGSVQVNGGNVNWNSGGQAWSMHTSFGLLKIRDETNGQDIMTIAPGPIGPNQAGQVLFSGQPITFAPTPNSGFASQNGVELLPVIVEGGPAGYTDLFINRNEVSLGSGGQYFILAGINNSFTFSVDHAGAISGTALSVKSGSNAKSGTFTLVAGAATVSNTSITTHSVIHASLQPGGSSGTITGPVYYPTVTTSTGFTVAEVGGITDASTYNYWIEENN